MTSPMFSIVIPAYNRADGRLQRALDSVLTQTWRDLECIVVDDGSTDETRHIVSEYWVGRLDCLRYIRHDERQGRVSARNAGMAAAQGEWICWLDSDDAWDQEYLRTFAYRIEEEPEARLWVCGAIVHGVDGPVNARTVPKWTKIRKAWMPPVDSNGVHEFFDSGRVGTGMFVFHRKCYEAVGPLPEDWKHPDHVADGLEDWLGIPFGTLGYGSGKRAREVEAPPLLRKRGQGHIGNPWGDDHAFFLALALKYRVHLIQAALYVHYVR